MDSTDSKDSPINRAMGAQIRAEKAGSRLSVAELAKIAGVSVATLNRIISEEPRDINITTITNLAIALNLTPETLVRRAVERAGGFNALIGGETLAERLEADLAQESRDQEELARLSDAADTTDDLEKKRRQREGAEKTPAEIDEHREQQDTPTAAQERDEETETDQPDAP